ncbi:hypothetical protein AB0K15_34870 [Amycolatopsis sp. NPDC049253]|uniref:hypothetical protein n=1 Tax=Amycolatopsis sp. NPDC049253 TaxID=3155274 RepID=UPI003444BF73
MGEIEPRSDTRVARIPDGSRAERAIGALGWWLPETCVAGLLAGLAAWAGVPFLIYVIGAALVARIAWEWPPTRRTARAVTALTGRITAPARRRTDDPAPHMDAAGQHDEVAS